MLAGLGWNMLRVWSTDWWYDLPGCTERLHGALQDLLDKSRAAAAEADEGVATRWDMGQEIELGEPSTSESPASSRDQSTPPGEPSKDKLMAEPAVVDAPVRIADAINAVAPATPAVVRNAPGEHYRIADLSEFAPRPERFFDFAYRDTLRAMVEAVVEAESPLRTDILCQRIARAHGWLRTGGKIRERIDLHLRGFERTRESSGEFLWKPGAVADIHPYRPAHDEQSRRGIRDIPLAELAAVVRGNPALLEEADPARELARLLGVERLAGPSRARLNEAIARARVGPIGAPASNTPEVE